MCKVFKLFKVSIGSKVQIVLGFKWFKCQIVQGLNGSGVKMVQEFKCFKSQMVHGFKWFRGSFHSMVHNFNDSYGSRVKMLQGMKWSKGSNGSRVHMLQGFNWFKG